MALSIMLPMRSEPCEENTPDSSMTPLATKSSRVARPVSIWLWQKYTQYGPLNELAP